MTLTQFPRKYKRYIAISSLFVILITTWILITAPKSSIYLVSISIAIQIISFILGYIFYRTEIKKWTLDHNVQIKYLASIYPGVAAVWLIFLKDEIYKNTNQWIVLVKNGEIWNNLLSALKGEEINEPYYVDIITVYYLITILLWLTMYFFFVTNESAKNEQRNEKLESTILRSPNPQIFKENILLNQEVYEYLSVLKTSPVSRQVYHEAFQYLLEEICNLTKVFMNKLDTDDDIYGANIMLYIQTSKHKPLVEFFRTDSNNCFHFCDTEISRIAGVLRLVPGLIFSNRSAIDDQQQRIIPAITLPVIRASNVETFFQENLAGAPLATFAGEFIINDVLDGRNYANLKAAERQIAKDYWRDRAPEVRSVISIRLPFNGIGERGYDFNIIGVLNIDSTKPFPLGSNDEFHPTYWSLILPLIQQISPHVEKYLELYLVDLQTVADGGKAGIDI